MNESFSTSEDEKSRKLPSRFSSTILCKHMKENEINAYFILSLEDLKDVHLIVSLLNILKSVEYNLQDIVVAANK